jgi:hypothetical protein
VLYHLNHIPPVQKSVDLKVDYWKRQGMVAYTHNPNYLGGRDGRIKE